MIVDYQDGGQKMLDIIEFNKALKISWILKYISNDCKSKWKCFFYFNLSKVGGKLVFLGNLAPKDARKLISPKNLLNYGRTLIIGIP